MPDGMRLAVLAGLVLWIGSTLLLSRVRWFTRPSLVDRVLPYVAGPASRPTRSALSAESLVDVIGPVARSIGETAARLFGVSEELAVRLERVHSPLDVTSFRLRQLGWATGGMAVSAIVAATVRPPAALATFLLLGAPVLAFLVVEQQLASASSRRQQTIFLELPVVAEQLAMLLAAGYSLGAALNRLAGRGGGACADDLRLVCARVRHGLTEAEALREWAEVARVPALDRLVPVLALNRETTDLGRLVSEEARTIRRDVQRQNVETMERRGQQVWIPVTVATLVPGVIFLAIPFIEALRLFSGS